MSGRGAVAMMDSRSVRRVLALLPDVKVSEIDAALSWLVATQRAMLSDRVWDQTAYDWSVAAIDALLDCRFDLASGGASAS